MPKSALTFIDVDDGGGRVSADLDTRSALGADWPLGELSWFEAARLGVREPA